MIGSLSRKWTVYLMHHSHTDLGYTDSPGAIRLQHIGFLREVLDILGTQGSTGFKLICEGLWGVSQFFDVATEQEKNDFLRFVRDGRIGLSGSYFNLTEAISGDVLQAVMKRALQPLKNGRIPVTCAMTADVNGYSWGMTDILLNNGVENLISFINPCHGGWPTGKTQSGFWWEAPSGRRLLAWVGDHYNTGNWAGLCPEYGKSEREWLKKAEELLPPYLEKLEKSEYPFPFCPLAISGVFTDNAPPNRDIPRLIALWNQAHGEQVTVKMATLEDFFSAVRASGQELPVYRGDWTDWWSDGIASTPHSTKLFREAQRRVSLLREQPGATGREEALLQKAEQNLMLYAEHTWGFRSSVSDPWNSMVATCEAAKSAYASEAFQQVTEAQLLRQLGQGMLPYQRRHTNVYAVVNPTDRPLSAVAILPGTGEKTDGSFAVIDDQTGLRMTSQKCAAPLGDGLGFAVSLKPREKRLYRVEKPDVTEAVPPVHSEASPAPMQVETRYFAVTISPERGGIVSLVDRMTGEELLNTDRGEPAFRPVSERTPCGREYVSTRSAMMRDRRSEQTKRDVGVLSGVTVEQDGPLFMQLKLSYTVAGTEFFDELVTLYRELPVMDVAVRFHKESVWEPENLYLSLPFTRGDRTLWIEKTNAVLRPGVDQLPQSCMSFYSIQEGLAVLGNSGGAAIACPDAPMVWLGDLCEKESLTYHDGDAQNHAPLYSWLMNNYWETNFKATLGGMYEFCYHVSLCSSHDSPQDAIAACRQHDLGVLTYEVRT